MTAHVLRPLSVGEILDVSFGLFRQHFPTFAAITAVSRALPLVFNVYVSAAGGWFAHLSWLPPYILIAVILSAIGAAATVYVVSESYLGRNMSAGEALSRAVPLSGRLIAYALLFVLIVGIGFVLLFVPGVILACGLILSTPALVLEAPLSATGALSRSWSLTSGSRMRMFGLFLVFAVLMYIPIIGIVVIGGIAGGGLASLAGEGAPTTALVVITAVSGVVQMLLYPLFYCIITVAYYDLRVRKEGFDLEVLASTMQAA